MAFSPLHGFGELRRRGLRVERRRCRRLRVVKDKREALGGDLAAACQHHNEDGGGGRRAPDRQTPQPLHRESPFRRAAFVAKRRFYALPANEARPFRFQSFGKIDHAASAQVPKWTRSKDESG